METWWDRFPKALEREKAALDALGYPWEIDEAAQKEGRLVILVNVRLGEEDFRLTAEYPTAFPYFPPQVVPEGKTLERHQHPFGKNLCLLAREGEDWQPGCDTLATLIKDQLPQIQEVNTAGVSAEAVAAAEDHVGEPLSSFLPYLQESAILVPDETPPVDQKIGRLVLSIRPTAVATAFQPVNGVLKCITDMKKHALVDFSLKLPAFSAESHGFWMRLAERPRLEGVDRPAHYLAQLLGSESPEFAKAIRTATKGQVIVAGFVYPDERSWRAASDDWIFVAVRIRRPAKGTRSTEIEAVFVRADWAGEQAWLQRAPDLRPLRGKSVLVVGLGSLGSPLVMNLARAGIARMSLVDCDHLQAGNTVRWALGWQFAGFTKARALKVQLFNDYPYTEVDAYTARIGGMTPPPNHEGTSDYDLIRSLAEKADLIIDAAASHRVSHFLADLAREIRKPYLWLTTTHGAAGGVVGRVVPGQSGGCWHCFMRHLTDGAIARPADSGAGEIQPGGCSQPTFVGAGLDSDEIAQLASRLTVSTLCSGNPEGYPDFGWDVGVVDLYANGRPIVPAWKTYELLAHPECRDCQQQ